MYYNIVAGILESIKVILVVTLDNNITAKIKQKMAWKYWKCVTDAANKSSQLRRDFNDVRKKFTPSSIINIT